MKDKNLMMVLCNAMQVDDDCSDATQPDDDACGGNLADYLEKQHRVMEDRKGASKDGFMLDVSSCHNRVAIEAMVRNAEQAEKKLATSHAALRPVLHPKKIAKDIFAAILEWSRAQAQAQAQAPTTPSGEGVAGEALYPDTHTLLLHAKHSLCRCILKQSLERGQHPTSHPAYKLLADVDNIIKFNGEDGVVSMQQRITAICSHQFPGDVKEWDHFTALLHSLLKKLKSEHNMHRNDLFFDNDEVLPKALASGVKRCESGTKNVPPVPLSEGNPVDFKDTRGAVAMQNSSRLWKRMLPKRGLYRFHGMGVPVVLLCVLFPSDKRDPKPVYITNKIRSASGMMLWLPAPSMKGFIIPLTAFDAMLRHVWPQVCKVTNWGKREVAKNTPASSASQKICLYPEGGLGVPMSKLFMPHCMTNTRKCSKSERVGSNLNESKAFENMNTYKYLKTRKPLDQDVAEAVAHVSRLWTNHKRFFNEKSTPKIGEDCTFPGCVCNTLVSVLKQKLLRVSVDKALFIIIDVMAQWLDGVAQKNFFKECLVPGYMHVNHASRVTINRYCTQLIRRADSWALKFEC